MNRSVLHVMVAASALASSVLVAGCSESTAPDTKPLGYYVLTGTPTPATVFNAIAETYFFGNNLTNSIWQRQADVIVTGEYDLSGYWAFPPMTATYANTPDNGTDVHARMVQIPATNTVVYSRSPSDDGVGLGTANLIAVATIDTTTGLLTAGQTAVFSDAFAGSCQLTSSSATEFLCYDGTLVRRYTTTAASTTLTANGTLALSAPLPAAAECNPTDACYGSTFAFDGAFYYFAANEGNSTSLAYVVYDLNGTLVNTYTATGTGAINGVYFDWSVGRYSSHDGFGNRTGATAFETGSDTHNFGAVSTVHQLQ